MTFIVHVQDKKSNSWFDITKFHKTLGFEMETKL